MAGIEDVRALGAELERSYPVYVHGRLKFRVKQIVYVAFSLDETVMEFAFPKEERAVLVAGEPHKFQLPAERDMRFNWVHADLAALDPDRGPRAGRRRLAAWSSPRSCAGPTTSPIPAAQAEAREPVCPLVHTYLL